LGDGVRFGAYVSEVAIRVMAVSWQSNSIHSVFSVVFLDLPIRDCHSWYYRHLVACFSCGLLKISLVRRSRIVQKLVIRSGVAETALLTRTEALTAQTHIPSTEHAE
jgi:hypothetical protein